MTKHHKGLTTVGSIVLIIAIGYGGYRYYTLSVSLDETAQKLASTTQTVQELQDTLKQKTDQNNVLTFQLQAAQAQNDQFAMQIQGISSTVSGIQKLQSLDPELLKKYSKVYFLNENYNPVKLVAIPAIYSLPSVTKENYIHTQVWPYLQRMLNDARLNSSTTLQVISGYRSFDEQSDLKSSYKMTYGSGANAFSADQGYSEHQLGTAVDINTPSLGGSLEIKFENTAAFKWMNDNAYRYGFILSYPKNNTYYQYEPWHWRFVGVALATKLHNENKHFYDLDQREIDSYLINIFD